MPSHDYSAVVGGSIKIKRVKGSRIDKSKKKPKKSKNENLVPIDDTDAKTAPKATATPDTDLISQNREYGLDDVSARNDGQERQNTHLDDEQRIGAGKTEAERRHEERRRKRLDERLKREGIKTHKEKVEELNRYLSNLSEHHDMPRIGPG